MRLVVVVLLGLGGSLLAGCGPNCQSTCQRIYSTAEDGCGIPIPGRDAEDSISDCVAMCEDALQHPGQLGDYDPNTRNTSGEAVTLENEKQAGAWMDCVAEADCRALDDGYCAPI
jgi:hypothetical protein